MTGRSRPTSVCGTIRPMHLLDTDRPQEGGDQGHRLRPQARLGHAIAHCTHAERHWECGKQRGRHPARRMHGRAHGFHPDDELIRATQLAEPARAGKPLLRGRCFGRHVRPRGRAIHHLLLMDAQDGVEVPAGGGVPDGQRSRTPDPRRGCPQGGAPYGARRPGPCRGCAKGPRAPPAGSLSRHETGRAGGPRGIHTQDAAHWVSRRPLAVPAYRASKNSTRRRRTCGGLATVPRRGSCVRRP